MNEKSYLSDYLQIFIDKTNFSRDDLWKAMIKYGYDVGESGFKLKLQSLLEDGQIARVGRNAYCVAYERYKKYIYHYSELANDVSSAISNNYPYLNYIISENFQFNEFVNHQLAHNVIYVYVEENLGDFVFEILKEKYPGKVLIEPTLDIYHKYWCDNMIVIEKMVSEAPKERKEKWKTRLEKLLVDLMTDDLYMGTISRSEYVTIFEDAFSKYAIDESCMFRYAKRRGAYKKIKEFINKETSVKLRIG